MSEKKFTKPDKPFLLIYTEKGTVSYAWLDTEEELRKVIEEVKSYGCEIQDAIEIGNCRYLKEDINGSNL